MPTFVLAYCTPVVYTPSPESRAAWMAWFDSMGDQLVDRGKPAVAQAVLGNCGPESTQLGGYSLIEANDLEAAVAVARRCPMLERGGGVEVGQLGELPVPRLIGQPAE